MAAGERLKVGDDLWVVMVDIADLREQDINAQVMQPRHFDRLTENIRNRGQIESLPYCSQPNGEGQIEIVSGHHRYRAARAAGLGVVPVLVDTKPMNKSQLRSKQISHNELTGTPDEDVLAQMIAEIDNVDDLLATGLDESKLPTLDRDPMMMNLPQADFDWKLVTLTFLPSKIEQIREALDVIDKRSEIVGAATIDQFEEFSQVLHKYGLLKNIRNMSVSVAILLDLAKRELQAEAGEDIDTSTEWVPVTAMTGTAMPAEAAVVVHAAIQQMRERGDINHPWQALELWAADYLSGG